MSHTIRCAAELVRASHDIEDLPVEARNLWRTLGHAAKSEYDRNRARIAALESGLREARNYADDHGAEADGNDVRRKERVLAAIDRLLQPEHPGAGEGES